VSGIQYSIVATGPLVSGVLTTPAGVPASGAANMLAAYAGALNTYIGGLIYDPVHNTFNMPLGSGVYRVRWNLSVVGPTLTAGLMSIIQFNASHVLAKITTTKIGLAATVNDTECGVLQMDIDTSLAEYNVGFYVSTMPTVYTGSYFSIDRILP